MTIADGCSSAKDSDIGARIIASCVSNHDAYRLKHCLTNFSIKFQYKNLGLCAILSAIPIIRQLGLDDVCLDSTVITSFLDGEFIKTFVYGDGNIIVKWKDGRLELNSIFYSMEAPYYLSYLLDELSDQKYETRFGRITKKVTKTDLISEEIEKAEEFVFNDVESSIFVFPCEEVEFIAITSDGLGTFFNSSGNNSISTIKVAKELANFKVLKGPFLKRRMRKALDDYKKDGIFHSDDLSMGVILL